ncbi:MAG: zinc-binding alcohol dehydrogenase family protein [Oenococcus sp.]|uniref:zinc-binding alcohol dehydrogenase family protein n=1 Tax=Oenococcus TaxID=46254 RepID=UPI0021E8ED5F|nr:zinc-binding alcohol dehydrogenase family protein [Oenococcus kitaharae]MCV3297049.1 zinc-binding alcohol dehydrogenase family protein [Oenococcus kitaharae]
MNNHISNQVRQAAKNLVSEKQTAYSFNPKLLIPQEGAIFKKEIGLPAIGEHDIFVQVQAVSVNPVDGKLRTVTNPEKVAVLGYDAFGKVLQVGKSVTRFHVGDSAYYAGTTARNGSNEQYQSVDERLAGHPAQKLTAARSAAMPLTSLTAYEILVDHLGLDFQSKSAQGSKMLVINGAGGVGSILVQMAAYLGIEVSVTAHSEASINWLKQYPIDRIYDYHDLNENLADQKFDYIVFLYDPAPYWQTAIEHIKPYGRLVSIVGTETPLNMGPLKNIAAQFSWEYMFAKSDFNHDLLSQGQALDEVALLLDAGVLKSTLNQTFDHLSAGNLIQAYALLDSGKTQGKIVLTAPFQ